MLKTCYVTDTIYAGEWFFCTVICDVFKPKLQSRSFVVKCFCNLLSGCITWVRTKLVSDWNKPSYKVNLCKICMLSRTLHHMRIYKIHEQIWYYTQTLISIKYKWYWPYLQFYSIYSNCINKQMKIKSTYTCPSFVNVSRVYCCYTIGR